MHYVTGVNYLVCFFVEAFGLFTVCSGFLVSWLCFFVAVIRIMVKKINGILRFVR